MGDVARVCLDCGVDISSRGPKSNRCEQHQKVRNKQSKKTVKKAWYEKNKSSASEYAKKWRAENPEKDREIAARYREKNPEKVKELSNRWGRNNPERQREKAKRNYQNNMEKDNDLQRRGVEDLTDSYVASLLKISVEKCPNELIDMKRKQLAAKRVALKISHTVKLFEQDIRAFIKQNNIVMQRAPRK